MLYFAEVVGTNLIKIGQSDDPLKREKELTGMKVLLAYEAAPEAERDVHERFAHLRRHHPRSTEVFEGAPELREFMANPTTATILAHRFAASDRAAVRARVRSDAAIRLRAIRTGTREHHASEIEELKHWLAGKGMSDQVERLAEGLLQSLRWQGLGMNLEARLEILAEWRDESVADVLHGLLKNLYTLTRVGGRAGSGRKLFREFCRAALDDLDRTSRDPLARILYRDLRRPIKDAFAAMLDEAVQAYDDARRDVAGDVARLVAGDQAPISGTRPAEPHPEPPPAPRRRPRPLLRRRPSRRPPSRGG
jgi:hypothetical protein